ncbi:hypothetical protein OIU84_024855 [Salix udensis]|uniref:Ribosomal RNA-processing protein 8 n=1 Tax=Salix udensis TaxID=889485 RepID=A0AAD6KI82_9ROSI|nr:hypothetical protein OIU84_024855 [Salix udensis]
MKETKSRKRQREKHGRPQNMASASSKIKKSSSDFLDKMRARLSGGHFRMINEKLYTCTGDEALNYFKEDPSLFDMVAFVCSRINPPSI